MDYLERVIKETMRLFPVGPVILRKVGEDLDIGLFYNYKIGYLRPFIHNLASLKFLYDNFNFFVLKHAETEPSCLHEVAEFLIF